MLWKLGVVASSKSGAIPSVGYTFGGGDSPQTTVQKLTFATDTWSSMSNLATGVYVGSSFSSQERVYSAGGLTPSDTSAVNYITKATDTITSATALSTGRQIGNAGMETATAGYAPGGQTTGVLTTVDKRVFSTDANSTLANGLPAGRSSAVCNSSPSSTGYYSGGSSAVARVSTRYKYNLSVTPETVSTLPTSLPNVLERAGSFNSSTRGSIYGGIIDNTAPQATRTDVHRRVTFSDDSLDTTTVLSAVRANFGAGGIASTTAGYTIGGSSGQTPAGLTPVDIVDKFAFSDYSRTTGPVISSARTWTHSGPQSQNSQA